MSTETTQTVDEVIEGDYSTETPVTAETKAPRPVMTAPAQATGRRKEAVARVRLIQEPGLEERSAVQVKEEHTGLGGTLSGPTEEGETASANP